MVAIPLVARERPIQLSISSSDLVLEGRFDHWVPMASEGSSPEEGSFQLLFDVTGVTRGAANENGDGHEKGDDLFSFAGKTVERIAPLAFVVKGTMKKGDLQQKVKVVVQTPTPHTPFVAITFSIDRVKFADAWEEIAAVLHSRTQVETPIMPRAWLRAPMVGVT
jgi:hypothetical protein